jgi:hypothetical protein
MTSHEQTTNDMTYFTDDLSSTTDSLALDLRKQTLIEEVKKNKEKFSYLLYKLKNSL